MRKLLLLSFLIIGISAHAQFFQGWGIFVGGTAGRQVVKINEPKSKDKSKYLLRYNGEVFAEFVDNPFYRWVTEVQYNVKGAKWEYPSGTVKYVNQYIAWNNYLMIRDEMVSIIPYAKIGPRLEYVFNSDNDFNKFHVTGALGAGVEFVPYGRIGFITEAFWVPDLSHSYKDSAGFINQHCWELRVGIKFGPGGGESCPKVYK
jgi:hypothetical protein